MRSGWPTIERSMHGMPEVSTSVPGDDGPSPPKKKEKNEKVKTGVESSIRSSPRYTYTSLDHSINLGSIAKI